MLHKRNFNIPWENLAPMLRDFTKSLHRKHREQALRENRSQSLSLIDWGCRFLSDHFQLPPSQMHSWLGRQLDTQFPKRGVKMNVLAPRGSAKSTLGTLAYPLREALEKRESYIWVISDTRSQAHAHLENIKNELLENHTIRKMYPEAFGKGPIWRSSGIRLKNGVVIEAYGTGQKLRGRRFQHHRPSLILCDDLQNDNHISSATAREHSRSWFHGTVMKAGNTQTNVLNLATALHREAIGFELTERPGWSSRIFKAIEQWPENMSLWEQWESLYSDVLQFTELDTESRPTGGDTSHAKRSARPASVRAMEFYEKNKENMEAGAKVLWPELENLLTLMKMRVESGRTAFEREKQNSPVNPEHCEWPESYFDESIWFEKWPTNLILKTMALDPSKGTDATRGDYSAFVMLGVDADGILYVDADLARRPIPEIIETGVMLYKQFKPDVFGVESNQFQQLLCNDFQRCFRENEMPHVVPYPMENRLNKILRVRRLGPYFSSRKVRFRSQSNGAKLLLEQLRVFPVGDHDDGPDAMEMAIRLVETLTR